MPVTRTQIASWTSSLLLAALPWVAFRVPVWAPLVAAVSLLLEMPWTLRGPQLQWRGLLVLLSAGAFLVVEGGWQMAAVWAGAGLVVGLLAWRETRRGSARPDAGDLLLLVCWGLGPMVAPGGPAIPPGGWLAPLVFLVAVRRLVDAATVDAGTAGPVPAPPAREVLGAVELEKVVIRGDDALARSVPLSLCLEPGESLAVLCDSGVEAEMLATTFAFRRPPLEGRVLVDGEPAQEDLPVAVIGPGERFLPATVDENLGALVSGELHDAARAAVEEACALDEVRRDAGGRTLSVDGSPLSPFHRLLLLAARVIPSHYRLLVVLDPEPWVNRVRAELWRNAVVRASVGRTAVWITPDRELASRAERVVEWRHGRFVELD